MIFERLKQNIRLLEQLTIFNRDQDAIPGLIPDTAEYLFLSVLKQLQNDNLPAAHQQYQQLCDLLGVAVGEGDGQLEPLRTLLHLKLWDGSEQDRQQLQQFLVKQMGLQFEAELPIPCSKVEVSPATAAATGKGHFPTQQLPSHISNDQYSAAAFKSLLGSAAAGGNSLTDMFDQSCLWDVIADESTPLQGRVLLLQQDLVPAPVLPVQLLVSLVQQWVATESWNNTPATNWVTNNWSFLTAEQAVALRPVLHGPSFGSNPNVDRPYIAALVTKALAGPAAAAAASPGVAGSAAQQHADPAAGVSSSSQVPAWSCKAADAAAAVDLQRVLQLSDQLGPHADWVRLHALHAQVQLQLRSQPCVDFQLMVSFMQLLGKATWTSGPSVTDNRFSGVAAQSGMPSEQQQPFGTAAGQQQQQPLHVACSVCGMRLIVGTRLRSRTHFGFNACVGCAGSQEAVAAGPLEEMKCDDSIYMLPEVQLPRVLGQLPALEQQRQALARQLLLDLVQDPVCGKQFSPEGPCPLAAAGLLLPADWRDAAVAEGKLLSGSSDTAAWSRMYQRHADVSELAARTELSFAQHNRSSYALEEEVSLLLDTKNVGPQGVLVKVYEINAWNYYTSEGKQVDLALELSGLAPSQTLALQTPQSPVIRTRHSIPLGWAGRPGVWLIEAVASGQVVRARIQKGSLRMTQRPTAAGQVLTILDEGWHPVKGVSVWCEGKEYTAAPAGKPHEVLLPYARQQKATSLVVAAKLEGAANPGRECVVLFGDFGRLSEQYTLNAQLFCHQESLLPGQAVSLLLQLALQMHGRPAPLQLLQDVTLQLTATTQEGADVTQVFKELSVDPTACQLQLQYNLPQGASRVAAALSAKLLLTLPGTNGEPAWQEFELNSILSGQQGQQPSIEINGMATTGAIWDVYLTSTTSSSSSSANAAAAAICSTSSSSSSSGGSSAAAPEYVLQVLGRSGEASAVPKTLLVVLNHVAFNPEILLRFSVQTGPGGVVWLGRLSGIRQIFAQIEAGVSHVQAQGLSSASAGVQQGLGLAAAAAAGFGGGDGEGPVRSWQVAWASWWQGDLQPEYTMLVGGTLELPISPASGQTVTAKLLQLDDPGKSSSSSSSCQGCYDAAAAAAIAADVSGGHLEVVTAVGNSAADSKSSSGSVASCSLGSAGVVTLRVRGLAAGLYCLVVPALLLQPPEQAFVGTGWNNSNNNSMIRIRVLPSATAAVGEGSDAAAVDAEAAADTAAAAGGTAADVDEYETPWLWCESAGDMPGPAVLRPSPNQQLHIASISCSARDGLSVQLAGTAEQLASVQLIAVFSRFLPDGTTTAQLGIIHTPYGFPGFGFGFRQGLGAQAVSVWDGSGNEQGLGSGVQPQCCGEYGRCSYSTAAKLDSAVEYVLQHRQWEQAAVASGQQRPGSLLERPSLLAMPRSVRSAASGTSVLRGGDGGRVQERASVATRRAYKKMMAPGFTSGAPMPPPPPAFGAVANCCAMPCAYGMPAAAAAGLAYDMDAQQQMQYQEQELIAQTPVLGFLKNPAVVLAGLEPSQDGSLVLPADQLQQLLAESAAAAALADGSTAGNAGDSSSSSSSTLGPGGFSVVHVAAYVLHQPGQFASCVAAVQGAAPAEAAVEQAARRDIGLLAQVDEDAISALTCNVTPLLPGDTLKLHNADACEAAVYSTTQQLYALLLGLLELAEIGGAVGLSAAGWSGSAAGAGALRRLLPRPVLPPRAQGSSCRALLRQWEPLLLSWHDSSAAAKQELLDKLGSAEMAFYLACRDEAVYTQMVLPLLQSKLPSELCCLEQILLLQAKMTVDRRALFDFALLVHRQLQQQEQQRQPQEQQTDANALKDEAAGGGGDGRTSDADTSDGASDGDFVQVSHADAVGGAPGIQLHSWQAQPMPMAAPTPLGASVPQAAMMPKAARMARSMNMAADLAARQQQATAAAAAAHLAPKETQEWAEFGWWKCEGQQAPAALIPPALFWAEFATHLATKPEQPFIPSDPTGMPASTAAITAALAVVGLPFKGAPSSMLHNTAAAAGGVARMPAHAVAGGFGCTRSYAGSALTLTATSPCLLWVKQVKAVASISAAAAAQASVAAGADGAAAAAAPAGLTNSSSSASTVLVAERLFDPRFAATTDPETGEQLLLSLQPSEQQLLLAGQAYCRSVVITSTVPSEQQLGILLQLPQGALPLSGSLPTTSLSISLAPYATQQLTACFYFPEPGVFKHAPVSVTKRGRPAWIPSSAPAPLHVAAQPPPGSNAQNQGSGTALNPAFNWSRFLAAANPSQILQYLQTGDLSRARLADLSPYCRDLGFFQAAFSALSDRHVFEFEVWKWAVLHLQEEPLRQLLPMTPLGRRAASFGVVPPGVLLLPLSADDVGLKHLEYWPWVNPYCRPIPRGDGGDANLPSVLQDNPSIAAHWRSFLMAALFDPQPTNHSSSSSTSSSSTAPGLARAAAAACCLLLQDRVDDAEDVLAGLDLEAAAARLLEGDPLRMQVDYLRAWMALVRPLPAAAEAEGACSQQLNAALAVAKDVVTRYAAVAAQPWRKRFTQLANMVAEVEQQQSTTETGSAAPSLSAASSTAAAAAAAASAAGPVLSAISLEGGKLKLLHSGISTITLSAYHIDTELLFTTQPFSSLSAAAGAAHSSAASSTAQGGDVAGHSSANDAGLGKVAFVQPTARVVLQWPLELDTPGVEAVLSTPGAGSTAAGTTAAGSTGAGSTEAGSTGAGSTGTGITETGSTASTVAGAAGSAGGCCCALDVDVLMPQLASLSVLLEVAGGGVARTLPRFASKLSVHVFESQGLLQACSSTADGRQVPAAAVYVKVFARDSSGDAWFYKDGYTDLRGKFDYVTLTSTADMSRVARYSLLAASPGLGSVMVQAAPPPK